MTNDEMLLEIESFKHLESRIKHQETAALKDCEIFAKQDEELAVQLEEVAKQIDELKRLKEEALQERLNKIEYDKVAHEINKLVSRAESNKLMAKCREDIQRLDHLIQQQAELKETRVNTLKQTFDLMYKARQEFIDAKPIDEHELIFNDHEQM